MTVTFTKTGKKITCDKSTLSAIGLAFSFAGKYHRIKGNVDLSEMYFDMAFTIHESLNSVGYYDGLCD